MVRQPRRCRHARAAFELKAPLVLRQRWIAVASYGVQHFGATGYETTEECLDDSKNEFVMASAPPRADLGPVAGHRRPGWRMEPE